MGQHERGSRAIGRAGNRFRPRQPRKRRDPRSGAAKPGLQGVGENPAPSAVPEGSAHRPERMRQFRRGIAAASWVIRAASPSPSRRRGPGLMERRGRGRANARLALRGGGMGRGKHRTRLSNISAAGGIRAGSGFQVLARPPSCTPPSCTPPSCTSPFAGPDQPAFALPRTRLPSRPVHEGSAMRLRPGASAESAHGRAGSAHQRERSPNRSGQTRPELRPEDSAGGGRVRRRSRDRRKQTSTAAGTSAKQGFEPGPFPG